MGSLPSARSPNLATDPRCYLALCLVLIALLVQTHWVTLPGPRAEPGPAVLRLQQHQAAQLEKHLQKCQVLQQSPVVPQVPPPATRTNPRWTATAGQNQTIILRNATLFDGDRTIDHAVDITLHQGVITHVVPTQPIQDLATEPGTAGFQLNGRFVTPGLVDMHSHHLDVTDDLNEIHPDSGPLTPFVRALDSLKTYDETTTMFASGGVTSSLILPGSANIMGGEAVMVKNRLNSGENAEQVVEDLLLKRGIPPAQRRRYMKMACGENPKGLYGHTRMGNAFVFRKQMTEAQRLLQRQDSWCLEAAAAHETGNPDAIAQLLADGGLPEDLALESSVAMLRGQIGINIHCYEPEDMEAMIRHSEEFGFRIQAFHHALEAWRVPEMIKASGQNITIAIFSHFAHYKHEAYDASLYAGKILSEHGLSVAYKSDASSEFLNAKYLLSQAAEGHSFGLPENEALKSVTSIPATSVGLNDRIGYAKPGYDADLVIWDAHPLSNGATPLQVYIDGQPTLKDTLTDPLSDLPTAPSMRPDVPRDQKADTCRHLGQEDGKFLITGIQKSFLSTSDAVLPTVDDLEMVLDSGKITCLGPAGHCAAAATNAVPIQLDNGHLYPGLTAVTAGGLGLVDIATDPRTGDEGDAIPADTVASDALVYAKYGLRLQGKDLVRAQMGGITKVVTVPLAPNERSVFLRGVSTVFETSGHGTILEGRILKDDVALHVVFGQEGNSPITSSTSAAIGLLRRILIENQGLNNTYGHVANGSLPLVVHVKNHHDMLQLVQVKRDLPSVNMVLFEAFEASLVAEQLAHANISLIYTAVQPKPQTWEAKDVPIGPPLTASPLRALVDAGVKFGIAQSGLGDSNIHNLVIDAGFARKVAGLSELEAVNLVSRNIEEILGLGGDKEGGGVNRGRDFVVFEGDPLEWGARVVLTVDGGKEKVVECWPDENPPSSWIS
ncbi:carbohydrate esterase family 9 protein-like protein [Aspergillus ibericus CBS 121593]|uniref:Carbohydrate esterase family 9 protein-like protein n=1 Tax=Aspergillus ibericus CBS 121593 TaxID=1448316 RepID=A0A395HBC0_9EURO|nr:carbohydrate esterase family 9 protein-like protein [Aspergillus ibericus CBS 121593]RAL03504.1 carbohydrate esterase family 9 protein-like protein [Aspergillus ibericus CBS 121593]